MIKTSTSHQLNEIISKHVVANVLLNNKSKQKSLQATVSFCPGDIICKFNAVKTHSFATYLTIQTGKNTHITLAPDFLQYINHSCAPVVFFNTTTMQLECIKDIQPGDELSFFYPSSEWEMAQPFVCNCGNAECLQLINGASQLTVETLSTYKLTDFIRQQIIEYKSQ